MGEKFVTIDDIEVKIDREKAYGIANGETELYYGRERLKIYWIPKALEGVELSDDRKSITMPTWKARAEGLI